MPDIAVDILVEKLRKKRSGKGIRETAAEIQISPATLSRVERGNLPDLETFKKICTWLELDPDEVLGVRAAKPQVRVHFKKESTLSDTTATALAELILAAQTEILREEDL